MKYNPKKEKGSFKNRIDVLEKGISRIEQDISWDIKKGKAKQEKLKHLEKERDVEKEGIDLEDDRKLER